MIEKILDSLVEDCDCRGWCSHPSNRKLTKDGELIIDFIKEHLDLDQTIKEKVKDMMRGI